MSYHQSETSKIIMFFCFAILISLAGNVFLFQQIKGLSSDLDSFREESAGELAVMNSLITSMQTDYQNKIDMLTTALNDIEKKSNIKITELEEELKGISIESGDFSAVLGEVLEGVVSVITNNGQGSGAIITSDGFIITNEHVIRDAKVIRVIDHEGNIYAAQVNGSNKGVDIAVLKVNPKGSLNRLTFTSSANLKVGEKVVAVGNPAGLGFSATEGIISQLGRFASKNNPAGLIQMDVPINPGNSGGAVVNIQGNIVGIAKSKIAGFESLGFAIPSDIAKLTAESIIGKDF